MDRHSSQLVEAAVAGDPAALDELWEAHRGWVSVVVLAYLPRESELEDVLQDVAVAVVQSIRSVRDPEAFRGWLRQLALNTVRASGRRVTRRRQGWRRWMAFGEPAPYDASSPETSETAVMRRTGDLARELPEKYREPLLLSVVQELTAAQIAHVLDRPAKTVETQIRRGRLMLREAMVRSESPDLQLAAEAVAGSA